MDIQKETELTLQGMADCMDMVRQELVEAGLIDEKVPPMFVSEALLARLRQLRAAFHVNMVRAYPARTHEEIAAEIDRTAWGCAITADEEVIALHRRLAAETLRADLAEARAAAKSRECIELRERMAARLPIPSTPAQAIGFIGNQFEAREDAEDLERVRFQLTVHDLLSAFRWWFDGSNSAEFDRISAAQDKSVTVTEKRMPQVQELTRDAAGSAERHPPRATVAAVTAELLAAGNAVVEHWHSRDWKKPPTADVIARLTRAVGRVKRGRELYTCIGKGGEYELVGEAHGAGTLRTYSGLMVYQDSMTGQMYCRSMVDFDQRMQRIEEER